MSAIQELLPAEFTEQLLPIFEHGLREAGIDLNSMEFFKKWRQCMEQGIARTWYARDCVLGALFTLDLYSNKMRASVMFWLSLPEARNTAAPGEVFRAFELAARRARCVDIQVASHERLDPVTRKLGHLKHGYLKSESVYCKAL